MDKTRRLNLKITDARPFVMVVIVILIALGIGVSFIIIPSTYAPLLLLAAVVTITALIVWLKKPVWALYFTVFMVLLPTSIIPAEINSYINRIGTVIAFVIWIVDAIRRRSHFQLTASTVSLTLFIIWSAITLLWAENLEVGTSLLQRYGLRLILFLILVSNEIRKRKDFEGFINTIALGGGLLIVASIATMIAQGYESGTRLQVLDVNANSIGLALLLATPAVLWWAMRKPGPNSGVRKWLAVIYLAASIAIIGLSGSRGSAISLGITLAAFLLWKPTRFWGLLGGVIIGLAIIAAPIVFSTTIERFLGAPGETILGGRESLWPAGWQLINDHLLLGVGIGNSPYALVPYLTSLGVLRFSPEYNPLHNPIMVIWSETGLPGLFLYLSIFLGAIISFIRQYYRDLKTGGQYLKPYYYLVAATFFGFVASWIKGGGIEVDFSTFLMTALLIIPSRLDRENLSKPI